MTCYPIKGGFMCLSNVGFNCLHCKKKYDDLADKYLNRCNKNISGYTEIKCSCGKRFGMTYNIKNDAVSFKLEVK